MVEGSAGVARAAATLLLLGSDEALHGGLGVVRIAEIVGGDKGQISRVLATLLESSLVERDEDTLTYRLGWQFYALAAAGGDVRLREAAAPLLRSLVQDLGERASLSVLRGAAVMTVLSESPAWSVQAAGWVGRTVPAHCTSSGRALLFDTGSEELAALFHDAAFSGPGPKAPATVTELGRRLEVSRRSGFAVVDEEFEPGMIAVAAPVRDFRGGVCAAINVSAPKFRLRRSSVPAAGRRIRAAADELSRLLGAPADAGAHLGAQGPGR